MAAGQFQMSLPSINEMFPEHMMHTWYSGDQRDASRPAVANMDPLINNAFPQDSITPRPQFTVDDARRSTAADYQDPFPTPQDPFQPPQAYRNPRWQVSQAQPPYDPRRPYPETFYSSEAGPHPSASSSYSFDLLRPHPLTSTLETVATSTNVALQPRVAYAGYHAPEERSPDTDPTSSQRARPTFRVNLSPEIARDNGLIPPLHIPMERSVDYARTYQDPPGYQETQYLPSAVAMANAQSLFRMGQSQGGPPSTIYDEKRHRCPHCNKRFNRPSSLNIHVNTHTGAKPFQCPYPGCQRRFNVNSNMRRHWRNHVTNNRRRDAVARLVEPSAPNMPPTPPLSTSPTDTPISQFSGSLPSSASSDSSTPLPSRSPSPVPPYPPMSEDEDDGHADDHAMIDNGFSPIRSSGSMVGPGTPDAGIGAFDRTGAVSGLSTDRRRLRSLSSPVPRYHDGSSTHAHQPGPGPMRARSSSCNVPGCECQPVSTTLRPAFPSSSMRSS